MLKEAGFYRGINLGGWMSQCDYSQERLEHFIEEKDFARIASWGLDHVRIPVDYNVLEDERGGYIDAGFARINRAVAWARKYGLNAVIDLHKTAGFSFDAGEKEAGFFESEACQERFLRLWEQIASRCGGDPDHVAFELLNEVTDERFIGVWNRVAAECIRRIRAVAPREHIILVGSYHNNSAAAVPALAKPVDGRVVYNFHCYDPLMFTHQGAYWVPALDRAARPTFEEAALPADYFERLFAPAIEAARRNGTELYCGEYGVIDRCDIGEALKWFRQIHEALEKHGISRAVWSYKEMDFGISDPRLDGARGDLLPLL